MSKPREWPNVAKEARDRSAEEAVQGIRALEPLLDGRQYTSEDIYRRVGRALVALQRVVRLMEQQGAPTRPQWE